MELKFRDLVANEIECRVGNTKRKYQSKPKSEDNPVVGFQVLLYKTARTDQIILDETVGAFNWAKRYYQVKNTMFCSVGIKDKDTNEWVWKDDAGDDDFQTEQVKGEASDSFKRAGFAWGIGRKNLYYGPFIWIKCNDEINEFTKMYVDEVEYKNSIISKLVIKERNTDKVLYSYGKTSNVSQTSQKAPKNDSVEPKVDPLDKYSDEKGTIRAKESEKIAKFLEESDNSKKARFKVWLLQVYGTEEPSELSERKGIEVCKKMNI